ncbi:MAG: response regulator [Synergistaceae bacterium]|jgi:signal transduction histidine kinase/CheY-like chemotaxis protein|nr:response regulator [Synergistaceae bacterium]
MNFKLLVRSNIRQLLVVMAAFFLMVAISYLFTSDIVEKRIVSSSKEMLSAAETDLNAKLREVEMLLHSGAFLMREFLKGDPGYEQINARLLAMTEWYRRLPDTLSDFVRIYGYFKGKLLLGIDWTPPEDFRIEERLWYKEAVESGGNIVFSPPYVDAHTGKMTVSLSQALYGPAGEFYGVICIDVDMATLGEKARSIQFAEGGYGMLIDSHFIFIAHPDEYYPGKYMGDISDRYSQLAEALKTGAEIPLLRVRNRKNIQVIFLVKRIANGWYIGMATPMWTYYRDVYIMAFILSFLGLIFACLLGYILLHLSEEKIHSDEKSRSKSSFLARMSHEIRTPMNAIIGMSDLALRADKLESMAECVVDIRQAGHHLLSIINDILDFSKIESGNMEFIAAPYRLASVLNDAINVTRMHILEKPVVFAVRADGNIRDNLIGDEVHVRQILLNTLSNAAKYTRQGFITLTVESADIGGDSVRMTFKVADSGIGIKKEALKDVFGDFVRSDIESNRSVEGTGLGLAITRNLCLAMGGDIVVESVYGAGSVFTVTLPQRFMNDEPLAAVENPQEKRILFYDERAVYAESVLAALRSLGVDVFWARGPEEFLARLKDDEFQFVFTSPACLEQAKDIVKRSGLRARLLLLANLNTPPFSQDVSTLMMPAYAVPIANVLNRAKAADWKEDANISFVAPGAKVLVVDDNLVNLKIAKGLLKPYRVLVDICKSGDEALALARECRYDIIFMDHMMPGMDGIETTIRLRGMEMCRDVPVVALTANAVSGMREMFLEKGMDDFLSKPIYPAKLEAILQKWIPESKQEAAKNDEE